MASSGDGTPGRWIFLGAAAWAFGLAFISNMWGHPVVTILLLCIGIPALIVWIVDSLFLDSELGDKMHRWVMGRSRGKRPTPFPPMQHSFEELSGAPDWASLRDSDGH